VQRSAWLPVAIVVPAFIIMPTGQLVLTLSLSPYVLVLYLALVALAGWRWWSRREVPRGRSRAASLLAHR
jgi:hypothetical protein